jgi:predicted transcriptional regulator
LTTDFLKMAKAERHSLQQIAANLGVGYGTVRERLRGSEREKKRAVQSR